MMIEMLVSAMSSVVPALPSSQAAVVLPPTAALVMSVSPRTAMVTSTGLDGADGKGTWLWHKTVGYDVRDSIRVADRPRYPSGRVDSVNRPGFNGVEWRGEQFIGGIETYAMDTGAAAYGAVGDEDRIAHLRVGPYVVGVNPFEEIRAEGKEIPRQILSAMEGARNDWLKQNGYVGGVRTFTNDVKEPMEAQAIDLTPKATIQSPTDLPRFRNKMEVRGPVIIPNMQGVARVSLPPTLSPSMMQPPTLAAK